MTTSRISPAFPSLQVKSVTLTLTLTLLAGVLLAAWTEAAALRGASTSTSTTNGAAAASSSEPLVRRRRQFMSCRGGWGPSCSGGSSWGHSSRSFRGQTFRARARLASPDTVESSAPEVSGYPRTQSSLRAFGGRRLRGIPSIVTSGGWEPGTMGKRSRNDEQRILYGQWLGNKLIASLLSNTDPEELV